MTFLSYGCKHAKLHLGVDSNISNVEDLRKITIIHLASMADLENEGQTHSFMTFRK